MSADGPKNLYDAVQEMCIKKQNFQKHKINIGCYLKIQKV